MRPHVLFPLFAPVTRLSGVGPRIGELIARAAGDKIVDLLWHLPSGIVDRRHAPTVGDAEPGEIATLTVKVHTHEPPPARAPRKLPYRVVCGDETGFITLVFFSARNDYLLQQFPVGEIRVVSGKVDIDDVNERLNVHIEREGFETFGGFLLSHLGRVPAVGEHFEVDSLHVEVLEVERRRIHRVRLTLLQPVVSHERERIG